MSCFTVRRRACLFSVAVGRWHRLLPHTCSHRENDNRRDSSYCDPVVRRCGSSRPRRLSDGQGDLNERWESIRVDRIMQLITWSSLIRFTRGRSRVEFLEWWNVNTRHWISVSFGLHAFIRLKMVSRHADTFHRCHFITDCQVRFHRHHSNAWQCRHIQRLEISLQTDSNDYQSTSDSHLLVKWSWCPFWSSVQRKLACDLSDRLVVHADTDWYRCLRNLSGIDSS